MNFTWSQDDQTAIRHFASEDIFSENPAGAGVERERRGWRRRKIGALRVRFPSIGDGRTGGGEDARVAPALLRLSPPPIYLSPQSCVRTLPLPLA